jgi:hypothetical protein
VTWVSWRLQRTETLITAGLLALIAALLVPEALHLASLYDHDGVARCVGRHTPACESTIANFGGHAGVVRSVISWFALLPGIIGLALAAPVLIDLENGTFRLAWTQSITRGRWVANRLSLAVITALAAGGILTFLCTWYRAPLDRVYGRMDGSSSFDLEGIVPLGYVLFALALALAVGVIWRRTAPAMITAFVGFVAVRLFVDGWLRQRFVTPLHATWNIDSPGPQLNRSWVLSEGMSDHAGHPFAGGPAVLQACARTTGSAIKGLDSK